MLLSAESRRTERRSRTTARRLRERPRLVNSPSTKFSFFISARLPAVSAGGEPRVKRRLLQEKCLIATAFGGRIVGDSKREPSDEHVRQRAFSTPRIESSLHPASPCRAAAFSIAEGTGDRQSQRRSPSSSRAPGRAFRARARPPAKACTAGGRQQRRCFTNRALFRRRGSRDVIDGGRSMRGIVSRRFAADRGTRRPLRSDYFFGLDLRRLQASKGRRSPSAPISMPRIGAGFPTAPEAGNPLQGTPLAITRTDLVSYFGASRTGRSK